MRQPRIGGEPAELSHLHRQQQVALLGHEVLHSGGTVRVEIDAERVRRRHRGRVRGAAAAGRQPERGDAIPGAFGGDVRERAAADIAVADEHQPPHGSGIGPLLERAPGGDLQVRERQADKAAMAAIAAAEGIARHRRSA